MQYKKCTGYTSSLSMHWLNRGNEFGGMYRDLFQKVEKFYWNVEEKVEIFFCPKVENKGGKSHKKDLDLNIFFLFFKKHRKNVGEKL